MTTICSGAARAAVLTVTLSVAVACSTSDSTEPADAMSGNRYVQTNLAANSDEYGAPFTFPAMVNAWGIANRPKGAGGHFWVGAGGTSFQFVGDVSASPDPAVQRLSQDGLREVTVPGADSNTTDASIGKITGVVFNPAPITSGVFTVGDQPVTVDGREQMLTGSSRFTFATDSGTLSAWTEQAPDGQIVRRDGPAKEVFNGADQGMAFFGLAISPAGGETLWAADFGASPQIRQFTKDWTLVPTQGFTNPFATGAPVDPADPAKGRQTRPGDPAPFNIATVGDRVFVTYAVTKSPEDGDPNTFDAGEEDSLDKDQEAATADTPTKGKIAEFDASGNLARVFDDGGRLNAPWGVAVAPNDFGPLSGTVLVANFAGAGRILAFDDATGEFVDYIHGTDGNPIGIEGIWGLLFGNGESLGDSNALYFTAGPKDEEDGLFGSLRAQN
ncbi:TIGR03118 family protein [Rhodococcus opacus]|uniref:TIGR03118 family protein n=1 Tax=Rhodococcus opacus TaxID=37919 RepID=UPI001C45CFF9|nr:TIGR03118 family protein [Rhodococcus opacus]MBV6760583.1 TIGR03118 family protein [Rhodococcus opacus]